MYPLPIQRLRPHLGCFASFGLLLGAAACLPQSPALLKTPVDTPQWLGQLLAQESTDQELSLQGTTAVLRVHEVKDPMASRVELKLATLTIPAGAFELTTVDIRKEGIPPSLLSESSSSTDVFGIVNAGYFGTNDGRSFYPLGLLVHTGERMIAKVAIRQPPSG
jgi:hypothetical protein